MLLQDNPDTRRLGSLYEDSKPEEASRLRRRFEFYYAPKRGSWSNMAEIEIGAMSRQCLSRRIPERETRCRETKDRADRRNELVANVDWRFRTVDARMKLKSRYPTFQRSGREHQFNWGERLGF
ncbi:MAG: hypothetical protein OXI01_07980 [Albidovulum sp.]|nr:hypothetical protein [Albidovulum sp.]